MHTTHVLAATVLAALGLARTLGAQQPLKQALVPLANPNQSLENHPIPTRHGAARLGPIFGKPNPFSRRDAELASSARPILDEPIWSLELGMASLLDGNDLASIDDRQRTLHVGTAEDLRLVIPFAGLFERGQPNVVAILLRHLRHEDAGVRWRCAWALRWSAGSAAGREAIPALEECLRDQAAEVRATAAHSLAYLAPGTSGVLPELLRSTLDEERPSAALLQELLRPATWDTRSVGEMRQLLGVSGLAQLRKVLTLLLACGPRCAPLLGEIAKLLHHEEPRVSFAAIDLVTAIGPGAAAALPDLERCFDRPNPSNLGHRRRIVTRIAQLGEAARPFLERAQLDADFVVQRGAKAGLARLDDAARKR